MTATTLSANDVKEVTDLADRESANSRKWAARLGLGAAGLAAVAVAAPLLGAAAVVGTLGVIGAGVLTCCAASYALNLREMKTAKQEAGKEGFVEAIAARSKKMNKFARSTNRIALVGILVVLGSSLPLVAGAAALLHTVGMVGWVGAVFASELARESGVSTGKLSRLATSRVEAAADTAPPLAAAASTPGLSAAPSPAPAFGLAANANEAKPAQETAQKKAGWRSKLGL